ncbi:MAG TPA: SH3 domain-containing protein [Myxococcaceae bacterium]
MRSRTPSLRFPAHALLVGLVLTLGLPASAEEALFVHATSLNLRAEPRPKANVVRQLAIGAQCQVLAEKKGGWVQLSCDGATGWTMRDLLGPAKPDPEQLLAQARDEKLSFRNRHTFALRALTLKPGDEEALRLTRETFFHNEHDALQNAPEEENISDPSTHFVESCDSEKLGVDACVTEALSRDKEGKPVDVVWSKADVRGARFVALMLMGQGELQVWGGEFTQQEKGRLWATPYRGYSANPSDALFHALVGRPRNEQDPKFIDPAGLKAMRKLIRELPQRWLEVDSSNGLRVFSFCDKYVEIKVHPDEGVMGSLYFDYIQDGESFTIRSVEQQGTQLIFTLREKSKSPLKLEYPWKSTTGRTLPVGRWSGGKFGDNPVLYVPFARRGELVEEVSPCEH